MINNEKTISALDFAEYCIQLVTSSQEENFKIKHYYRENKICVDVWCLSQEDLPEYSISEAYEYFRFACFHRNIFFYKKYEGKIIEIKEKSFIKRSIKQLFECKGVINGEDIYISKNIYEVLLLPQPEFIYNTNIIDNFMLKCFSKLVKYILNYLNISRIPDLKSDDLNSYIDVVFPPDNYDTSGFSLRKKQALIYMFDKTKIG